MATLIEKVTLRIDGNDYKDYNFMNIVLSQQLLSPNQLSFTMQRKEYQESLVNGYLPVPREVNGAKVECLIESIYFNNKDQYIKKSIKFEGIVFNVTVYPASGTRSEQLISVLAYSNDYLLKDHPHCCSYENMTLKEIVAKTLSPYSIPNEINPKTTGTIPYTVQYNESDYEFLTRLARRYGEWMYHDGVKWHFGKMKDMDNAEVLEARNDLNHYTFQTQIVHHKIKHAHHDYLKYENSVKSDADVPAFRDFVSTLTDDSRAEADRLFTKPTFQHLQGSNPEGNEIDELEVSTHTHLLGEQALQTVCTGSTVRCDLTIGSGVWISEFLLSSRDTEEQHFLEPYMITSIIHSTEVNGSYRNTFSAISSGSKYPPYCHSDLFPVSSAQRAKVMENIDPEKMGRIRVQFLWQEMQDPNMMTPWIRIAQPYGGENKGFFFIPEIGEEVMVDFENGNAEKPYVTGTLWHGKQRPREKWYIDNNNEFKGIRSRNNHQFFLVDITGAKGYVGFHDTNKNKVLIDADENLILIESLGDIKLIAENNIILQAKNDIIQEAGHNRISKISGVDDVSSGAHNYNAGGQIYMKGPKIHATGNDEVVISSDSLVQLESESTVNILGDSVNIHSSDFLLTAEGAITANASQSVVIEANAPMTLEAPTININ